MKTMILISNLLVASLAFGNVPQIKPPPMKLSDSLPANLFVELGKIINPAVVNISTSTLTRSPRYQDPMMELFEQFYGMRSPRFNQPKKPQQMALGTGFVIREDGLIITNAHVVKGADLINVQFDEKSEQTFEAKILGLDERSDIAVLKINPKGKKLVAAALGNSKDVQVGEWVAAFGNPFGHGHTLTKGIVSSLGREIGEINRFPMIQTDAAINPGNSGGPLVNAQGYVIGVNSAIDARAQGIGFAIPIDEVKRILPDLENRGSIRKGYLGVGVGDMNEQAQESIGQKGAVITGLDRKGPAYKAGLKMYDLVTECNGKKIKNSVELLDSISDTEPGQKVKLKVMRQSANTFKPIEITLNVTEPPKEKNITQEIDKPIAGTPANQKLGFSMTNLNANLRERFELPDDLNKPIVTSVEPGSTAAFVGVQVGDIILDVNSNEVSTVSDVNKNLKKEQNTLRLARGNQIIIISF